ncbi:hypothetical protein HDV00_008931 [Rhizophlyctis rosea]|nr:hypothetical protein HDV00_008931 [Rhizophlyctis rosea]
MSSTTTSQLPKVVLTRQLPPIAQNRIDTDKSINLIKWPEAAEPMPRAKLLEAVKGAEGLLVLLTDRVNDELLNAAGPQLKVVSTMSVGYDHIDVAACRKRNVRVGYTPDVLTDATADLTVGLLLTTARRFQEGVAVATRLRAFGIGKVLYTSPSPKPEPASTLSATHVPLPALLHESDIVIVTCALTPQTHHLFNSTTFSQMKSTSIFINTARGGIVDQVALAEALGNGTIAAAGLDVTDPEPLDPQSELLKLDNCTVLPHLGSATVETREAMAGLAIENLVRGVRGQELVAEVV